MSDNGAYEQLLSRMMELAFGRSNDVARLVLAAETMEPRELRRLELGQVAELKRMANGAVEVRLVDKLKLMELLAELLKPGDGVGDRGFWAQLMGTAPGEAPEDPGERG